MLCDNNPTGHDLILCSDEDARLWIGTSALNGLSALFTDLATGRVITIDAVEDTNEWYVIFPELVVGHAYLIQLAIGITPVQFYPYVLTAGAYVADTTLVDGVAATVVKVWEVSGDTYYTSNDQHLSIP